MNIFTEYADQNVISQRDKMSEHKTLAFKLLDDIKDMYNIYDVKTYQSTDDQLEIQWTKQSGQLGGTGGQIVVTPKRVTFNKFFELGSWEFDLYPRIEGLYIDDKKHLHIDLLKVINNPELVKAWMLVLKKSGLTLKV